ncbi:MAG: gliding motility-associated C-terminal domain-containing protein, partial [Bacteroidetes bacterium]|nr:gliding motility-associated C-terminal domain-containing protein [Bacteroidota bacterium]
DSAAAGIFTQNLTGQNGCDSVVITTVTLLVSDTTQLSGTTCDPGGVGVFEEMLMNQNGCDSVVITTVALLPDDSVEVSGTSCDPTQTGIFTAIFSNQFGCDSVVVTTVSFSQSDTTLLASTTCDAAMAGIFVQNLTNQNGCDSLVVTSVSLVPTDTTALLLTSCNPGDLGVFEAVFTNQFGCDSLVVTTVVFSEADTTLLNSTTCDPSAAGVFVQNLTNQFGCDSVVTETVTHLPGDTTFLNSTTCDPSAAGVFVQNLTNQFGCDSVVVTAVVLAPPPVLALTASDFNGFGVSCADGEDGSISAVVTGAAPFSFGWSNGSTVPLAEGLPADSYTLTVTDANGCSTAGTAEITAPPPLATTFAVTDLDCFGQNDGAIFVETSGGVPPYEYSSDGGNFQSGNAFTGLGPGAYETTVLDANGCGVAEIVLINVPVQVNVALGNDLTIESGENTTLTARVNFPFDSLASVTWSPLDAAGCPGCLSQPVAPIITTTYAVSIAADNGCQDSDEITVFVERRRRVYVPTAFSPDGDGLNDVFTIFAKPNTVKNIRSFLVFSRWGESVFEYFNMQPNNPATGWDGSYRGQLMGTGVFVWFAEVEFPDGAVEVLKGDVTLIR